MSVYYSDDLVSLHHGDCLDVLRTLPDASVDAVVTDPPYGLANTDPAHVAETITRWVNGERDYLPGGSGFMGAAWDAFVPPVAVWDDCLRVLKPGGHVLAFAGSRTVDLMTLGLRLAGFEIRDSIAWLYGSGFPKSLDVSKAIDKAAGAEREVVGTRRGGLRFGPNNLMNNGGGGLPDISDTVPATPDAERWQGWGTALKPAFEPIVVARKPLAGTVAANVLEHGTGALNIDGCRIETDEPLAAHHGTNGAAGVTYGSRREYVPGSASRENTHTKGRWPTNVVLDDTQADELDRQSGESSSGGRSWKAGDEDTASWRNLEGRDKPATRSDYARGADSGGASRFFPTFRYEAKAPTSERPRVPKRVLRLRDDLTPEQADHVRARLTEAGVRVD